MHLFKFTISHYAVDIPLSVLICNAQKLEGVVDYLSLYLCVKLTISLKTGSLIDFNEPWLRILVD